MHVEAAQIRNFRLRAHHLDRSMPMDGLERAAGACGLQNSPPGAWETALFHRLEGCTEQALRDALYRDKRLLQAWSFRGAPVVFPTAERGTFLAPLAARPGEAPWIYTRGVSAALDFLRMDFDALLPLVRQAAACLDGCTVRSKEALDRLLADRVEAALPPDRRGLWNAPSMYGAPDRQTAGGAAVSFLLRPCSFLSLVVFGAREGASPTFTSFRRWTGRAPEPTPDADRALVRKFLHCYGPAAPGNLQEWLGCSPRQARRLWSSAAEELAPVTVDGRTRWLLACDLEDLRTADGGGERLLLLGAHDPYLDLRDRDVILARSALRRVVWQTVSNPGVVLRAGRAAGVWRARTGTHGMTVAMTLWESLRPAELRTLEERAAAYAAFRGVPLERCAVEQAD